MSKYRKQKIKVKHQILKEALPYLDAVQAFDFVKLIVPDAIVNRSHGKNRMKLSTTVDNGFKMNFGGAGAQKYHIVCEPTDEHRRLIEAAIEKISSR